jgi:hypothetical protein
MFARSLLSLMLALGAGCSNDKPNNQPNEAPAKVSDPAKTTAPSKAPVEHAPAGVTPGSHEDWCGEHEVPESQCTRCNAELIPAFKATKDWCPEHGLPESQCTICNPGLVIQRPPKGS